MAGVRRAARTTAGTAAGPAHPWPGRADHAGARAATSPRKASTLTASTCRNRTPCKRALGQSRRTAQHDPLHPRGKARDLAVTTLRLVIKRDTNSDATKAAAILAQVQPDSPGNAAATVAACIGVALGLLDDWLSGADPHAPDDLGRHVRLPAGHWRGERAATDILVLGRKGRAFSSLDTLIARQGGEHVLYGSALTLTAATQTWAAHTDTPVRDIALAAVR